MCRHGLEQQLIRQGLIYQRNWPFFYKLVMNSSSFISNILAPMMTTGNCEVSIHFCHLLGYSFRFVCCPQYDDIVFVWQYGQQGVCISEVIQPPTHRWLQTLATTNRSNDPQGAPLSNKFCLVCTNHHLAIFSFWKRITREPTANVINHDFLFLCRSMMRSKCWSIIHCLVAMIPAWSVTISSKYGFEARSPLNLWEVSKVSCAFFVAWHNESQAYTATGRQLS